MCITVLYETTKKLLVVEALLWPALADTVFISTPAISCKVMLVCLSEWGVTIGSPALARDFCSHTRSSPWHMSLPSKEKWREYFDLYIEKGQLVNLQMTK